MASIGKAEDWPWKTEAAEAAEAFATDEHEISRKEDKAEELATEGSRSRSRISHGRKNKQKQKQKWSEPRKVECVLSS